MSSIFLRFRDQSTLTQALVFSVLFHGALLSVRFVDPERFDRVFQDSPLEVILVNAKANEAPQKAQAIAQTSLAGGGDMDSGRATTPLPFSATARAGDAPTEAERQVEALQAQQTLLLEQVSNQLRAFSQADSRLSHRPVQDKAQNRRHKQMLNMLAEIDKRIQEENARPKKRYVSPATRQENYAAYYDNLRRKVEDRGTQNFPQAAGNKLYGELTMMVTVNHDGRVIDAEVVESSGITALDRRAQTIAKAAGPFGPFTTEMRSRADQIVVVSRFKFTRDQTLETKIEER